MALTSVLTENGGWSVIWVKEFLGVLMHGAAPKFPTWFHASLATLGHSTVLPTDVRVGGEAPRSVAQASRVPAEVL